MFRRTPPSRACSIAGFQPRGAKDHSLPANALDAGDRDTRVNVAWPLRGLYLPDPGAEYAAHGKTFLVTLDPAASDLGPEGLTFVSAAEESDGEATARRRQ